MGMALKEDVVKACMDAGTDKPIDLAFLSAQAMGDANLEMEILSLFAIQLKDFTLQLRGEMGHEDIRRFTHTLKGAARSVGANALASLAEHSEREMSLDRAAFKAEFLRVCNYIGDLQRSR